MRMRRALFGAAAAVMVVSAAVAGAQERRQSGGGGYNVANEKTMTAKIVGVQVAEPEPGQPVPFLAVTVNGEPLRILLGPTDWIEKQQFDFPAGATATITGVGGFRLNGAALMPREIKVGAKTLTFRDAKGQPVWEK